MQSFMGKLSLHSTFLYLLHLKSTAKTRDDNLRNSQLLKEGDNTVPDLIQRPQLSVKLKVHMLGLRAFT